MMTKTELSLSAIDAAAIDLQKKLKSAYLAHIVRGNNDESRDDVRYVMSVVQDRLDTLAAKRRILMGVQ